MTITEKKLKPVSFRLPDEIVKEMKRRADYLHCTKTDYVRNLILRDGASEESEESLITFHLQNFNKKLDHQNLLLNEYGNLFLEFIRFYFRGRTISNDPKAKEKADHNMELFLRKHIVDLANGKKVFLKNIYAELLDEDDFPERVKLRTKVREKLLKEPKKNPPNAVKEATNEK